MTAARAAGSMNEVTPFDSVGLRRALVDWYALRHRAGGRDDACWRRCRGSGAHAASGSSRRCTSTSTSRARSRKTAALLNLHRNAVSYRVNQIFELLEIDPDNADDRLLLQLACRARNLTG